ncbi:UNVERIFIED_CONTAM: hypothetical protein ABID98_004329 [Brevibacillus sp. OAP136]
MSENQQSQLQVTTPRSYPASKKVYVQGSRADLRVPAREVSLHPTKTISGEEVPNKPVRLYDTSGVYTDEAVAVDIHKGLAPLRKPWILERNDVEEYEGQRGKALRAKPGKNVTQMHYARRGIITPEMEFIAIREGVEAEFVRKEVAEGPCHYPVQHQPP